MSETLTREQVDLFWEYVIDNADDHDDDCPEDDTCACSYKPRNDAVNAVCDYVRHVTEAAITPPVGTWRPMETAPKDGSWFLIWQHRTRYPAVCRWFEEWKCFVIAGSTFEADTDSAHWQPLPLPPAAPGGEG